MVKNCGDYIHFQIAERNILGEMVKIVKKKVRLEDALVPWLCFSSRNVLVFFEAILCDPLGFEGIILQNPTCFWSVWRAQARDIRIDRL